jgi:hypothetical protein
MYVFTMPRKPEIRQVGQNKILKRSLAVGYTENELRGIWNYPFDEK